MNSTIVKIDIAQRRINQVERLELFKEYYRLSSAKIAAATTHEELDRIKAIDDIVYAPSLKLDHAEFVRVISGYIKEFSA
jgi:uncharacterized membrane protein